MENLLSSSPTRGKKGEERRGNRSVGLSQFPWVGGCQDQRQRVALRFSFGWIHTLTSSSICSYGEASGAGAVVGPHGIVADMGAGVPCGTFIFIWKKKQKGPITVYTLSCLGVIKVSENSYLKRPVSWIKWNRNAPKCHPWRRWIQMNSFSLPDYLR